MEALLPLNNVCFLKYLTSFCQYRDLYSVNSIITNIILERFGPRSWMIGFALRSSQKETFPPHGATVPSGPGSPHYGDFTISLRHITISRSPLDEWSAWRRDLYLTTHNNYNRQISVPSTGFEPATPTSERPLTQPDNRETRGSNPNRVARKFIKSFLCTSVSCGRNKNWSVTTGYVQTLSSVRLDGKFYNLGNINWVRKRYYWCILTHLLMCDGFFCIVVTHKNDSNCKATVHLFTFSHYVSLYGNFVLPGKAKPSEVFMQSIRYFYQILAKFWISLKIYRRSTQH